MARWKIIEQKLKSYGKNITFSDATTLLEHYGYAQDNKGKTSGSRVRFILPERFSVNWQRKEDLPFWR